MPDLVAQITGALRHGAGGQVYAELLIARELYGHLLTLGMRPFSEGNDLALLDAQRQIDQLLAALRESARTVFTDARLQLIEAMLRQSDVVPIKELAQTVVRPIRELFDVRWTDSGYVHLRDYAMWPARPVDRVIVSVGPTIGIGDEILMAHALLDRASRCGIAIEVETMRPTAWTTLDPSVRIIGTPPMAAPARVTELDDGARRRTMVLRGDFLPSDPSPLPWYLPSGLGATARWTFGNANGIVVDAVNRAICHIDYPSGMPASRPLETRWVAARLLHVEGPVPSVAAPPPRVHGTNGHGLTLLMQVLTSKPSLMLPPAFYAECLATLQAALGTLPHIRLLRGPTPATQAICENIAAAIRARLDGAPVELAGPFGFDEIGRELDRATALFAPDTFTGHLAAMRGVPQVMLQLPEHRPWVNPSTPTFVVAVGDDRQLAVRHAAERLRFVLATAREPISAAQRAWAEAWVDSLEPVREYVVHACDAPPPPHPRALAPHIERVSQLRYTWERSASDPVVPPTHPSTINLERYPSALDGWRAVADWYVTTASSDVSAAAQVLRALS